MTGRFPIANAIKRDGGCSFMYRQGIEMVSMRELLARLNSTTCAFFDISVASELYWTGKQDYYQLKSDFGPMRPPFPMMWMEWSVPRYVSMEGQIVDRGGITRCAAAVTSSMVSPEAFGPGERAGTSLRYFGDDMLGVEVMHFQLQDDVPFFIPYGRLIGLNPADGMFADKCVGQIPADELSEEELASAKAFADTNPVWMALNLINCRNVTTKATGQVFARSGREKRQGKPVTRYHTIMLPGMSSRSHVKHSAADKAQMASHRVRGHFKTFTPERPLLGKHVGTYWWGWNMRGSKEHGEIKSDYTLGETG